MEDVRTKVIKKER